MALHSGREQQSQIYSVPGYFAHEIIRHEQRAYNAELIALRFNFSGGAGGKRKYHRRAEYDRRRAQNLVFILFPFGALGADSVEHGILRAEGEPVVLKDMLRDLVEKAALDMEQLPAFGAFEMIVIAAVRAVADILIARALPVVEHELAHATLAQHLSRWR